MNSSASQKTYIRLSDKVINDPKAICALVEIIAKHSQDKPWRISVDGKQCESERIRRISIDKFYALVTQDKDAFYKFCKQLPVTVNKILKENPNLSDFTNVDDSVYKELKALNKDWLSSLYLLAFKEYDGFNNLK